MVSMILSLCGLFALLFTAIANGQGRTCIVLWFDTEDYVDPISDVALRIATDLEKAGVRATFKVVGEKARVLEARGRYDVIEALSKHCIGITPTGTAFSQRPLFMKSRWGY